MSWRFLSAAALRLAVPLVASLAAIVSAAAQPVFVEQGPNWAEVSRVQFYTLDQGSRMIPLAWLRALKQANGEPFLADALARYGYLPNPISGKGLPVGFTTSGPPGAEMTGMTCSACHTRQIQVGGKDYRIDGGPAIVDFQSYLADLDTAVLSILKDTKAFKAFAAAVLGPNAPTSESARLLGDVTAWSARFHTLISRALPQQPWGYSRLDAVGMIFNRLAGLDVGPPPSYVIASNIKRADAPVRYPFLWNAAFQAKTQWPGFADNGTDILGLARNTGEVIGVFGVYEPKREGLLMNFMHNSVDFKNLWALEDLIKVIGPPQWPFGVDSAKNAAGKAIYDRPTEKGGCVECHMTRPVAERYTPPAKPFPTPVQDVQTDTREYDVLAWTAQTGSLKGAFIPFVTKPLGSNDLVINMLKTSVIGMIAESVFKSRGDSDPRTAQIETPKMAMAAKSQSSAGDLPAKAAVPGIAAKILPTDLGTLPGAFATPPRVTQKAAQQPVAGTAAAYESRVLEGIWAAAPYLHNGSVPTLAELLKPSAERVKQFRVGPAYDVANVGIKVDQTGPGSNFVATGCDKLNSGNSNCGHEFGTSLSATEKDQLLEYLKTL